MEDDFEMEGEEETWSIVGLLTWPLRTVVKWIIMAMIKAATGGPKNNIDKYADKLAKENLAKERELDVLRHVRPPGRDAAPRRADADPLKRDPSGCSVNKLSYRTSDMRSRGTAA